MIEVYPPSNGSALKFNYSLSCYFKSNGSKIVTHTSNEFNTQKLLCELRENVIILKKV
jgi:hypothetical protein